MNNFASTLCLVVLCSAIVVGSSTPAAAQKDSLNGTYTLDEADSDNISAVIEGAVGKLNFLTRLIARGRLKKINPAYRQVTIASSSNELSVAVDNQPALRTPANGTSVVWVGPDGGKVNVSMQLAGGHLVQIFKSTDGRRVNDYTLSPDGRMLIMQVTETSPRLSQAIRYKQVYRRDLLRGLTGAVPKALFQTNREEART
jgi:sugar lactone lactonase YvrE